MFEDKSLVFCGSLLVGMSKTNIQGWTRKDLSTMEIHLLPAEYGDAIIIKTLAGGSPYTIVVDGGPQGTSNVIAETLEKLGHINLMVLTHFDEDHIKGLIKYVERFKGGPLPVDKFWCNCAQNIDLISDANISDAGYRNANTLATFFRNQINLNPEFEWRENIQIGTYLIVDDLRIDVVSPSPEDLEHLKTEYNDYILRHAQIDEDTESAEIASYRVNLDATQTIDDLAKTDTPRNVNLWNQASIAFLLRAEGKQVLMTGDANADTMVLGIKSIPDIEIPVQINLMKLAHHGSKNNISQELLSVIKCDHFAFTTNGGIRSWYHPDRKTLALILRSVNRDMRQRITFYFNYPLDKIQKRTGILLSDEEREKENCVFKEQNIIAL